MSTTNKRLFGPAQLTDTAATKYTVPASTKTIVKYLEVSNPSANSVNFTMSIGADAAATRLFDAYPIQAGTKLQQFVMYVLDAAEIIQAFGSVTNTLVMTLDGVELTPG